MTEGDWLCCGDAVRMLAALQGRADDRRLWLVACACCRLLPGVAQDDQAAAALRDAEDCADGRLERGELHRRWEGVTGRPLPPPTLSALAWALGLTSPRSAW